MDLVKPLIENIIYPYMEKVKGNCIRSNLKELQESQYWQQDRLKQLQENKLRKLLLSTIVDVPAYQTYSSLQAQILTDPLRALSKFPILDKGTYRKNPDYYLNRRTLKSSLIPNQTGGSTGEPIRFYIDRHCVEYYEAARWRGLSWWGITPGSRSVMIWGNPFDLSQGEQIKYRMKEKWLKNRIIISANSIKPEEMVNYLKKINDFCPDYIYGYASVLYSYSAFMLEQKLKPTFILKAVVSTAETLYDYQRKSIERAFHCPVVNEYGARDGGILAYQCPFGNMHISAENAILEVVDEKTGLPLPSGKSGLLLVTDLNNFSMPRLRFKIGDRVTLSDQTCECGRGLPLIKKIDGRENDMLITVDGRWVHGHVFNYLAHSFNAIRQFQIIQKSLDYAELKIIKERDGASVEEVNKFISGVEKLLPGTRINVQIVDQIPVSGSGKFRYAIREFSLP